MKFVSLLNFLQLPCCVKAVFFRDKNTTFAGTSKGEILEINLTSKSAHALVSSIPSSEILCACTVQTNSNILAGHSDGGIYIIDGASKEFTLLHLASEVVTALDSIRFPLPGTDSLCFKSSKPTVIVAAAYSNGCIELRDLNESFNLIHSSKYESEQITRVKISPVSANGFSIAIGYNHGIVKIISSLKSDLLDWQVIARCSQLHGAISHIDWSVDMSALLLGSASSAEATVWSISDNRPVNPSDIANKEWASHTCPFGWQMLGVHQFLCSQEILIGRHIKPAIGLRVKRSLKYYESLRKSTDGLASSLGQRQRGTIVSLCNEKRCIVAWESQVETDGHERQLLSRHRTGCLDDDGSPCYDLVLVKEGHVTENEMVASDWCETHINEKMVAFGDLSGNIYLINYPCPVIEDGPLFKASIAHPRDKLFLKFSSEGKYLFSFSKHCEQVLQWKCNLENDRTSENLIDFLLECVQTRASVCLHDFLVALHKYGEQLYGCNTVESLLLWKRYSNILLNMYESAKIMSKRLHDIRNSEVRAFLGEEKLPNNRKIDVFERLCKQQQRTTPVNIKTKVMKEEEGVQEATVNTSSAPLRPISGGRFYREKSRQEFQPQSIVQILRRGVHAARKEFCRPKKEMNSLKSKHAEHKPSTASEVPSKQGKDLDEIASKFNDYNRSCVLVPEFEGLSPHIFGPLKTIGNKQSTHRKIQDSKSYHGSKKNSFEIVRDIFETILSLKGKKPLTENHFKDILYQYPEVAVRLGLRSQMRYKALFQFDFSLNKNVASQHLRDAIEICASNISGRRKQNQIMVQVQTGENEVQTSENEIKLLDFLVEFCEDAVCKAYRHLHASDSFDLLIDYARSELNIRLMPFRGPEDIRLEIDTECVTNSYIDMGSVPLSNHLLFPIIDFQISPAATLTEDSVIALLKGIGLDPEICRDLTISELFNIIQSSPLSSTIGTKRLSFDALVDFLISSTSGSNLSARHDTVSSHKNRNQFALIRWIQPEEKCKTAQKLLSFRTAKYIFDTLDSNKAGFLTHSEFIRGLRLHKNIAELLGLPQTIRQEDGSREKYQEMFMCMDPFNTKKICRSHFLGFFCGPEEKQHDPLWYGSPEQVPLSLPDPNSIFILTMDEAERAFHYLDFPCTGTLTKPKFQIGLGSYPALARRLGMPSTLTDRDGSNQFFDIVFGHISQAAKQITFMAFSKYFSTRLEDRTLLFFRVGSTRWSECIGWLPKAQLPKPSGPRYVRHVAVQAGIETHQFHPPGFNIFSEGLMLKHRLSASSAPVKSVTGGAYHGGRKRLALAQQKKLDEQVSAKLADEQFASLLHSKAAEDKKSRETLDQAIDSATSSALELVCLAQTPTRVMDPESEALAAAVICKIALCCFHPGPLLLEDLESAGEKVCSKINEVRGTREWPPQTF